MNGGDQPAAAHRVRGLRGCLGFLLKPLLPIRWRLDDSKTRGIAPLCLTFLPHRSTRRLNNLYLKQIQTASKSKWGIPADDCFVMGNKPVCLNRRPITLDEFCINNFEAI